jgi:hypothetical protein
MKSDTGKRFTPTWKKAVSYGNATEGFQNTGMFPYNRNGIPLHKLLPSVAFEVRPLLVPCLLLAFVHCRNFIPLLKLERLLDRGSRSPYLVASE